MICPACDAATITTDSKTTGANILLTCNECGMQFRSSCATRVPPPRAPRKRSAKDIAEAEEHRVAACHSAIFVLNDHGIPNDIVRIILGEAGLLVRGHSAH